MIMIIIVNNSRSGENSYSLEFLAYAMHYSNFE